MSYIDPQIQAHLTRIWQAAFNKYDLEDVVKYVQEKTYLNGDKFSFEGHEFQQQILSDTHPNINVQKCQRPGRHVGGDGPLRTWHLRHHAVLQRHSDHARRQ